MMTGTDPASNGFCRPDVPTGLEKPLLAEQIAGGNWHFLKSTSLESEYKECLKIEAMVCGYYGKTGKVRKVMHKTHHE